MRPLAELDAHGIEGIVFDVDDTITRDGVVEREAFDALWALRERGMIAIAATGRPLGWSDAIAGMWPVSAAVGENGAGWALRRGVTIQTESFELPNRDLLERILIAVRAAIPDITLARDQLARRADLAFDVGESVHRSPEDIARIVTIIEAHGARALVSTVHAHAITGAWDKAKGAVRAAEALGIVHERARTKLLFVGDSGNDSAAFAFFEHTVGVANVAPHLGKLAVPPRFVTQVDRGRGFAELVAHVLEARH